MNYILSLMMALVFSTMAYAQEVVFTGGDAQTPLHPHTHGAVINGTEVVFGALGPSSNREIWIVHRDVTGKWNKYLIDRVNPSCCDGHEVPVVTHSPVDKHYYVIYGPITAGRDPQPECNNFRGPSPFFRKSVRPNDPSAWEARIKLPLCGGLSEPTGGFTSDGTLHLMGQHQWTSIGGIHPRYEAFDLDYIRRSPDGQWEVTQIVNDDAPAATEGPCMFDLKVYDDVLYMSWGNSQGGCAGKATNVYSAISRDGGDTWQSWNGRKSFGFDIGIFGSGRYNYDSNFLVYAGPVHYDLETTPHGVMYKASGKLRFAKWNGSGWNHHVVGNSSAPNGLAASAIGSTIVAHVAKGWGDPMFRFESKDGGVSWTSAALSIDGRSPHSTYSNGTLYTIWGNGGDVAFYEKQYSAPVVVPPAHVVNFRRIVE